MPTHRYKNTLYTRRTPILRFEDIRLKLEDNDIFSLKTTYYILNSNLSVKYFL